RHHRAPPSFPTRRSSDLISAVSNGGVWDFPSPDMMQEVEVKAVGVSAEYANFQGGVVNIVLKSGGNQFHGIESLYWIPPKWVGKDRKSTRLNSITSLSRM